MATARIKRGDEVVILSGTERGKRGKVIEVLKGKDRAIVEGIHMIKRHTKKTRDTGRGAIVEREGAVHISKLMLAERFDARVQKRGGQAAPSETE